MAIANKDTLKQLGTGPYAGLLLHIRSVEAYNYNSIAGDRSPKISINLTKKRIIEIDNDKSIKSLNSNISERQTAVGAYQILKENLIPFAQQAGIGPNDLFSKENQDLMAIAAIERAIGNFRRQQINDIIQASEALCKIWAGLRCLAPILSGRDGNTPKTNINRGMSYYAGVSINANNIRIDLADTFQSILSRINPKAPEPPSTQGISPILSPPKPKSPITPIPEGEYLQFIQD